MSTILALAALVGASAQSQDIRSYVQRDLRDASFAARIIKADRRELGKIKQDYSKNYVFDRVLIKLKEPYKIRLETEVEDSRLLIVYNGPSMMYRFPRAGLNSRQDLAKSPGRRQSTLDFGILTPSLFDDLFNARFVRVDRATGDSVFDVTYQPRHDPGYAARHRVWVDRSKGITNKREWYDAQGQHLATFYYENPRQVGGVWLPTRLTVRNVENKVAGVTAYDAMKVNTGLADSLFATR